MDGETPITTLLPEWLREAATAAALKQGKSLDDMLRLAAYEYAERHAPEKLALQNIPGDEIPPLVRLANSVLRNAIDKQASEVHLLPNSTELYIYCVVEIADEPLFKVPNHLKPQLYDRFVTMASRETLIPGKANSFEITTQGNAYRVRLNWNGDYRSEMLLQIEPL